MREAAFVRDNARAWEAAAALVDAASAPAVDTLSAAYTRVVADAGFARTFYPGSEVERYLNDLSARLHGALYRNRPEPPGRVRRFWAEEVPLAVWHERRSVLAALAVFVLFCAVGLLSELRGGEFARVILGDAYVNMTIENIERGEPMGVYAKMDEAPMALAITVNNVRVSFLAFIGGILGGVGTLLLLLNNGVMVGTFHGFLYEQGVLGPALLAVWTHGTLELTAIALAGGAGFAMARGMLFPGTLPRSVSFARGARRGLRLIVGLVPVFVAAGFIEGFLTRWSSRLPLMNATIILLSALFLGWYFVWRPLQVGRAERAAPATAPASPPIQPEP